MVRSIFLFITTLLLSIATSYAFFEGGKSSFPTLCITSTGVLALFYLGIKISVFIKDVYDNGLKSENFLYFLFKVGFVNLYFYSVAYFSQLVKINEKGSVLIKGGFTPTSFDEIILLVFLLLLALVTYKRCLADLKARTNRFIDQTVKTASWLFIAYGFLLILPFLTFDYFLAAIDVFWSPSLYFNSYPTRCIFENDETCVYMVVVKLIMLVIGHYFLRLVSKYYRKFYISHNYFVISILLIWANLFWIGVDDIFTAIAIFDIISILTTALIILHEKPKVDNLTRLSVQYFPLSVFTSWFAFCGAYFLSSHYGDSTFRFYYMWFINNGGELPNGFILFAWFLIAIKVVFLVGAAPFYKYMIDVGTELSYPAIYYWSVVSKLPVIVFTVKFFLIVSQFDKEYFFTFVLLVTFAVSILYASCALYSTPRLKHFFAYSSMVNIPIALIIILSSWKAAIFVVLVNFAIYAVSMFAILLYLSSSHKLEMFANVRLGNEVDSFENFLWASQQMRFSAALNRLPISKDVISATVKIASGISALVLMGAAPFAGFFLKYLIVYLFASVGSFFICSVILLSTLIGNLAYFSLFATITEKVCKYSGRVSHEWVLLFDEDDIGYFQFIIFFNLLAIIFLVALLF